MKPSERAQWSKELEFIIAEAHSHESVCIVCHQNADADAVCSAYALQVLLKTLRPSSRVAISCPDGVNASAKQLLDNLGIQTPEDMGIDRADLVMLVDTNTLDQLGEVAEEIRAKSVPFIVVDHHHPHPETVRFATRMIVDESASAAAEVVYNLFAASGQTMDRLTAMALLAALFMETKHFLLARKSTFEIAAGLVESGAEPRRLSEMLGAKMSRSERMARLKAAGRIEVVSLGDWILATSELGSYQSSAARALLGLGAHVALVGGKAKEKVRLNMRATEEFASKTGIHLGRDLAIPLGAELGGGGGGHPTAAGFFGKIGVEETIKKTVERVRALLGPLQN